MNNLQAQSGPTRVNETGTIQHFARGCPTWQDRTPKKGGDQNIERKCITAGPIVNRGAY